MKREAGVSPARSRRCKGRVLSEQQTDDRYLMLFLSHWKNVVENMAANVREGKTR